MSETPLTREFVAQRDTRIYAMRASGMAHTDIAKNLDISVRAVTAAISRQTRKLNKEASYFYPEVLRLELDRLDKLQASVWPLAHHRKIMLDDGSEMTIEPDLKAVETLLKISQDRRKLLGMDVQKVAIDLNQDIRHTLHGQESGPSTAIDHKTETLALLRLMLEARILDPAVGEAMVRELQESGVIDVPAIEDKVLEIPPETE